MQYHLAFNISEASQVGEARRKITGLAASLGFSETKQGEIALVVTEIATNLIRHAAHGELFTRVITTDTVQRLAIENIIENTIENITENKIEKNGFGKASGTVASDALGIEITAVDNGPGMTNLQQCMQDGYSTAGTAGNGLGAIARLSHLLDIYTLPGEGTVLVAQVWAEPTPSLFTSSRMEARQLELSKAETNKIAVGVINRPKPGQEICGDSWAVEHRTDRSLFFVADGLGHGPDAAVASQTAVLAFRKNRTRRLKEIIDAVHLALAGTRGAAVAVAEIDLEHKQVCFAGIGNITGCVFSPLQAQNQNQSMVSHNGIVGHQIRKIQEFVYRWEENSILVMHSDGLSARWQLNRYPGISVRHPRLIAGLLYRDFQRQNDDATVLVGSVPTTA